MACKLALGLIAAAALALVPSQALSQASLILPEADFPAHAIVKVYHHVGNITFDSAQGCRGSFGNPYFHHVCADALNRTGGWVETGTFLGKHDSLRQIGFDVVASTFLSPADAAHAYTDFVRTVQGPDWGGEWHDAPRSITVSFPSRAAEFRLGDSLTGIWGEASVEVSGLNEIEAVVFWSKRKDSARATFFLSREMADAIAIGVTP